MKRLFVNLDLCIGCLACQQACAMTHRGNTALRFGEIAGTRLAPSVCRQCVQATCVSACPVGALVRTDDGVVVRSEIACIGCLSCAAACPFGALSEQLDGERVVTKCDNCEERLSRGLEPACVATCPTGARLFLEVAEVIEGKHGVMVGAASLRLAPSEEGS